VWMCGPHIHTGCVVHTSSVDVWSTLDVWTTHPHWMCGPNLTTENTEAVPYVSALVTQQT